MKNKIQKQITNNELYMSLLLFLLKPIMLYLDIPGTRAFVSIMFVCVFAYYCVNDKRARKVATATPMLIWAILTVYHCINATIKKVPEVDIVDYIHGAAIYSCLGLYTYFATISFKMTIKILATTFMLYMVIAFGVCDFSNEELEGRMSGVIYATELAQTAAILFIYIAYLFLLKRIKLLTGISMAILPIAIILLTQTRNAIAMVGIFSIGTAIAFLLRSGKNKLYRTVVLLIVSSVIIACTYSVFLESDLASRFIDKAETNAMSYYYQNNATGTIFDTIVGDRLFYYIEGWYLMLTSPATGIGMWNFRYVTGQIYPLHSEYMVHLCEGGIIGFALWFLFIIGVFYYIGKAKCPVHIRIMNYFIAVTILFCGIYAREFFHEFFYPAYALALALYIKTKRAKRLHIANTKVRKHHNTSI